MKTYFTTVALSFSFAYALAVIGPAMDDNSEEFTVAADKEQAIKDAARKARLNASAQKLCGENAGFEWVSDTEVQCFTHRGKRTIKGNV